jgi:phage/plasmid primase-like uncharacterized protein
MERPKCECTDPGCPVHPGKNNCTQAGKQRLYRIDMVDSSGTWFCSRCAADAMECGLFDMGPNFYSE